MAMYAVAIGREQGLFYSWEEVQQSVKGYSGAKFRKVETEEEGLAYIEENALVSMKSLEQFEQPIGKKNAYFTSPMLRKEVTTNMYLFTDKLETQKQMNISDLSTVYYKTLEQRIRKHNPIKHIATTTTILTDTDKDIDLPTVPEKLSSSKYYLYSVTEKSYRTSNVNKQIIEALTTAFIKLKPDHRDVVHLYTNNYYLFSVLEKNRATKNSIAKEIKFLTELKILYRLLEKTGGVYVSYIPQGPSPDALKLAKRISVKLNKI